MKLGERQFLKMNHIPAPGQQFFLFFQIFFTMEAAFLYSENGSAFFNKSFIRPVETDFLSSGNSAF